VGFGIIGLLNDFRVFSYRAALSFSEKFYIGSPASPTALAKCGIIGVEVNEPGG
jgi:hypothetical protein